MSESIVTQRSLTFVNNSTPASITTSELNLDTCYTDDEIVIKVYSAALNPVDLLVHRLLSKWVSTSSLKTYSRDYAGIIVRMGKNVDSTKWSVGDKVNGFFNHLYGPRGTLSDYLIINPTQQASITHLNEFDPKDFPEINFNKFNQFDINASYPLVFGTAFATLFRQNQKWSHDSKILVIGASTSVSNCLVQIAKNHLHVGKVVGICNSKSIDHNSKFGYDHLVPYDQPDKLAKVQDLIRNEFNGEKFDLIFDSVGNSDFFNDIETYLKPKSTNSQYITIAGDAKLNFKNPMSNIWAMLLPFAMLYRTYNPFRKFNYHSILVKPEAEFMELAAKMIKNGEFKPQLDSRYDLSDFEPAIERLESNKAKGKVVVRIRDVDEN